MPSSSPSATLNTNEASQVLDGGPMTNLREGRAPMHVNRTGTRITTTVVLGALGRGMVAGAVGTVAMTVSQRLEMAVTGRAGSQVPGEVGAHLVPGKDPGSPADVAQLNNAVHWGHGIAMGAVRGALGVAGLSGPRASLAHFALVWGGDAALYRGLGISELPWHWTAADLGTDMTHKGLYAGITGATYDALASAS